MEQAINQLFKTLSIAIHHNDAEIADTMIHSPCTFLRKQGTEIIHSQHDAFQSLRELLDVDTDQQITHVDYQLRTNKPLTSKLSLIKIAWSIQQPELATRLQLEGSYFVIEEQQQLKILSVIADGEAHKPSMLKTPGSYQSTKNYLA